MPDNQVFIRVVLTGDASSISFLKDDMCFSAKCFVSRGYSVFAEQAIPAFMNFS